MILVCWNCGAPISAKWLFLGLPWSTYRCSRCGSVFAGTPLRLVLTSISVGVFGYVLIAVIKGRMVPAALIIPAVVAVAFLVLRFPGQIRKVK